MNNGFNVYAKALFSAFLPPGIRQTGIVAGGALRAYFDKTETKDIDVFFRCEEDFLAAAAEMDRWDRYVRLPDAGRTTLYLDKQGDVMVNLIGFAYGDAWETIARFDFRCCRMAAWMVDGDVLMACDLAAVADATAKRLVVLINNGLARTERRVTHYVEDYGYHLDLTVDDHLLSEEDAAVQEEEPAGHAPTIAFAVPTYVAQARPYLRRLPLHSAGGY